MRARRTVTVPSFLKEGRSLPSFSAVMPGFGNSSAAKTSGSPLRCGTLTAQISSPNQPAPAAASARCCEVAANASCSSRLSAYLSAMFSAVMPMW